MEEDANPELLDDLQVREEALAEESFELHLMEDEVPQIELLAQAADSVCQETKIVRLLEILERQYEGMQVLFFTEYKATQALVMSALMQRFGADCVTFINGDKRIDGVIDSKGATPRTLTMDRSMAADNFNAGKVRFLVSTEAAGEGIDLQESCHTLIHVYLPWNPMRLHQRVGRLNRYGQKHPVEVVTLRNPDTVESRIWDKLNAKIQNIMIAFGTAMDEPEDLLQLVLGMTSPSLFTELFSEASKVPKDSLSSWFDAKTKTFGGHGTLDTVKSLVGNSTRFDYQNLKDIPRKDLQDLQSFFEAMLQLNKRRIGRAGDGLSFKTPEEWLKDPGVRNRYEGLVFSREVKGREASLRIVGVGHRAFDQAIEQARQQSAMLTAIKGIDAPVAVFRVFDRITGKSGNVKQLVYAILSGGDEKELIVPKDWQVLDLANRLIVEKLPQEDGQVSPPPSEVAFFMDKAYEKLAKSLREGMPHLFEYPSVEPLTILWPAE